MKLEIYYDYICPYCLQAYKLLEVLTPRFPQLELIWKPCESHPRPDPHQPHSDLLIQGMLFAQEQGVNLWEYHRLAYHAAQTVRVDVENPAAVAQTFSTLLEETALLEALKNGRYLQRLKDYNDDAFVRSGVWAVPAYRSGCKKLDAVEGVGVTAQALETFLQEITAVC